MKEDFVINNGSCHISEKSCRRNSHHMLPVMDWMSDIPSAGEEADLVEVWILCLMIIQLMQAVRSL